MKAILFSAQHQTALSDVPKPEPQDHQVVVAVKASGICHTDFEVLSGNYGTGAYPLIPGHEFAGEVQAIGDKVRGIEIGMRVVVDPNFGCTTCAACQRGWSHLCEALCAYGVTHHGGFAEFCAVDQSAVVNIGEMPFDVAALAEPMGCVLNGLEAVQAQKAQNALIIGAGPMGLLLAVGLRAEGVGTIVLSDIDEARLRLAQSFGFETVEADGLAHPSHHHRYDLAIDATGRVDVAQKLPDYICNGGKALYFGVCPSDQRISISPFEIFRRQLSLCGSHSLNHNIKPALEALAAFGDGIKDVISHRLPIEDVARIFTEQRAPRGALKIQANWS